MRTRFWPVVGLFAFVIAPLTARAQDDAPSLIVRVRSIDSLMEDGKYLAALVGQEENAKQIDGFIKSMVGKQGLEGIDTKRPFGFYGTVGPNGVDSTGVLLVPVADEKAFVSLLDRLNLNVKKGDGGIYTFTPPNSPTDAYFRIANKYAYVTAPNKSAIDTKNLPLPTKMLPADAPAALSISVRFDRIPDSIKQIILGQAELKLTDEADRKHPEETDTQQAFRKQLLKEIARRFKQVFTEGEALTVNLDVNRKTGELTTDVSLTGKAKSALAADIAELGKTKNLFTSVLTSDAAVNLMVHGKLPASAQQALTSVFDEIVEQALKREKDEKKRAQAQAFLEVVKPTITAGELDGMLSLRGPNKEDKYTLVFGFMVKDGDKLLETFRTIAKDLKDEEQKKIKFDADKVGDVAITEFLLTKKDVDQKARELLGDNSLYMAIRPDAVLFGFGAEGLAALKEAVAAKPQTGPQFQLDVSIRRLAPAMERGNTKIGKFLQEAFGADEKSDSIRVTVEGGKALQAKVSVKAPVVKFFVLLAESKKAAD